MTNQTHDFTLRETEEAVLCCLLVNRNSMPEVAGFLRPEMFSSPDLGFIYTAILAQYDRGEQPDFLTTEIEMQKTDAGTFEKVKEIIHSIGRAVGVVRQSFNIRFYAAEIRRQASLRQIEALGLTLSAKGAFMDSDPVSLIREAEEALLSLRENLIEKENLRPLHEIAEEVLQLHRDQKEGIRCPDMVFTGFRDLDAIFGGFQPGELFILGGRPGDGKTAIALQIAMNAAMNGNNTDFYSLEMSNLPLLNRLFTAYGSIHPGKLRHFNISEEEYERMDALRKQWKNLPFQIDHTPGNTLSNIRAQLLLKKKKKKCNLVVIDYLHLLDHTYQRGETMATVIGRTAQALKNLAREAECTILALSQLNRESERRPDKEQGPGLIDLRDSGGIEQAADGIFFAFQPARHGITEDKETGQNLVNCCRLLVRKNRNGIIGDVTLRHNNSFTLFTDYD